MSSRKIIPALMAATIAFGSFGAAGLAFAKESMGQETNEAQVMQNAKITMQQAIATAEQAVGGKATGSGIDDENGVVTFEVEVVKDGMGHKVLIDTQTGKITKQVMASADNDDDGDND